MPGHHIGAQIEALRAPAIALALNFNAQNNHVGIQNLAPAFNLFDPKSIDLWLRPHLPQEIRGQLIIRESQTATA